MLLVPLLSYHLAIYKIFAKNYPVFISEINECTTGTPCGDVVNQCANTPSGLYTCVCSDGYARSNIGTLAETCEGILYTS